MTDLANQGFTTRAVHAGERVPPGDFIPVVTPIHPTVGFLYESMDDRQGSKTWKISSRIWDARFRSPAFDIQII